MNKILWLFVKESVESFSLVFSSKVTQDFIRAWKNQITPVSNNL